jgi:TRAP-type C4-dicarboxylate transport system permease small subunit
MKKQVDWLCNVMSIVAGFILLVMVAVTMSDVVLRYFGRPILGAYEIVAFLGVAVTGFALPRASALKTHVYVDLLIDRLPARTQKVMKTITRILVFLMFLGAAWYFIIMGINYINTKTVSMSLRVPFYPVVFVLALSCIVQCMVSLSEIFGDNGEKNE